MVKETIAFLQFGAMADILYATPILRAIRARHPEAHITWFVRDVFSNVVETNPYLDTVKVYTLPAVHDNKQMNEGIMWDQMKQDAAGSYDHVYRPQMWPDHNFYRSQRTLLDMMGENCGFDYLEDCSINLDIMPEDILFVNNKFNKVYNWNRVITINHISYAASPVWSFENYDRLVDELEIEYGLTCLVTGASHEPIPEHCIDARGITYRQWAECIDRSALWFGLDSGAVTLAAATNTPMIKLHSPDFPMHKTGVKAMRLRNDNVLELTTPPTVESMVSLIESRRRK
jgi:ADP-heptose:LPS heptosyltransferase